MTILLAPFAAQWLIVGRELPRADAILILGGATDYKARAELAARMYRENRAAKILLTDDDLRGGWSNRYERNLYFVERAKLELEAAGVAANAIEILPEKVYSTRDEATAMRAFAKDRNIKSFIIVTSDYHTRRARWTFDKAFENTDVQIGIQAAETDDLTDWRRTNARGWRTIAGEYMKLIYYFARY